MWWKDEDEPPNPPQRPRRQMPSHAEIMHKVRCDTYHLTAIRDVLGEERAKANPADWTPSERKAIGQRQAELRKELGL